MIANFNNFRAFLEMGGYAGSVWSAYGIVFFALFLNRWLIQRKFKKTIQRLRKDHANCP